jgi:GT2 family glycosyltransferase
MGSSHLVDTLSSLPVGMPIYLRDNRLDNWGVAKSWNWGIRQALADGADYVLVLNDDVRLITPDFIDRLVADVQRDGVILASGRPEHLEPKPNSARPAMSAFCCDRRLFEEIGEFDEAYWPAYFEDSDILHRISVSPWKTFFDSDAVFKHWVSSTGREFPKIGRQNRSNWKRNRQRFLDKWGANTPIP